MHYISYYIAQTTPISRTLHREIHLLDLFHLLLLAQFLPHPRYTQRHLLIQRIYRTNRRFHPSRHSANDLFRVRLTLQDFTEHVSGVDGESGGGWWWDWGRVVDCRCGGCTDLATDEGEEVFSMLLELGILSKVSSTRIPLDERIQRVYYRVQPLAQYSLEKRSFDSYIYI
jgi:hypothetical protein